MKKFDKKQKESENLKPELNWRERVYDEDKESEEKYKVCESFYQTLEDCTKLKGFLDEIKNLRIQPMYSSREKRLFSLFIGTKNRNHGKKQPTESFTKIKTEIRFFNFNF
jgi:hypothetical protein